MFIMLKDYYNGEEGYDAYFYCGKVVTEKVAAENYRRIKIFSSAKEAREYAIRKYYKDIDNIITNANNPVSTILKDDENTFMYTNPVNETIAYKWVNLSDSNMVI